MSRIIACMDMALDTQTGDYTGTTITTLGNAVYLRLMTPLGKWWADPTLGSRLHELEREKDVSRVRVLARQFAQLALQPLIDDGRAKNIAIEAQQPLNGRVLLLIEVEDATGQKTVFQHPVKVL